MCYSGCKYENHNGGCNKPVNKACPQREEEWAERIEELVKKEHKRCQPLSE